jgi:hypothetical protein
MARPERQFQQRAEGSRWYADGEKQAFTSRFQAKGAQVPNNPDNYHSQSGAESRFVRRNPYGDAEQDVTPETPVFAGGDQWADRASAPNVDPRAEEVKQGPGFGFGSASPLNRIPVGGSYAAQTLGAPAKRGPRGIDFGTGRRNAPKPGA